MLLPTNRYLVIYRTRVGHAKGVGIDSGGSTLLMRVMGWIRVLNLVNVFDTDVPCRKPEMMIETARQETLICEPHDTAKPTTSSASSACPCPWRHNKLPIQAEYICKLIITSRFIRFMDEFPTCACICVMWMLEATCNMQHAKQDASPLSHLISLALDFIHVQSTRRR